MSENKNVKKPYYIQIWGGGGSSYVAVDKGDNIYAYGTNPDKLRHAKEAIANRLEIFLGNKDFSWADRKRSFLVELTDKQLESVKSWEGIKKVFAKE